VPPPGHLISSRSFRSYLFPGTGTSTAYQGGWNRLPHGSGSAHPKSLSAGVGSSAAPVRLLNPIELMDTEKEGYQFKFDDLKTLRDQFEIRADLLPADLALVGLLDDLLDASTATIEFVDRSTRVVYPLVRTAFEAAQRIVALATDEDYLRIGTRAWLYYQQKDASVRRKTEAEKADQWLEQVIKQMHDIWIVHNPAAEMLLTSEISHLKENGKKKPRPPDNFMGKDLADVVQSRCQRIYGTAGIPDNFKQLNRGIYAALSRDSHARLRMEPAALIIQPNRTVRVIPRRVDETAKRRTLLHCLESSLAEAYASVSFLLEARRQMDGERLRSVAGSATANLLPPGFSPDLGLHLMHAGGVGTSFHFSNVPIRKIGVLPDGTVCWSANILLIDCEYIATFDVAPSLSHDFASVIGISPVMLAPSREIVKHTFNQLCFVSLECRLGSMQHNGKETFVPFIVKRVTAAENRTNA
jgi:hypothetical protein